VTDHFPKGSVIRRVNIEPAIMFGAGRALLLQLAHPAVAQGVEDHSEFKKNPFQRLLGTVEATYAVVFGSDDLARGVGRRIQWIHTFVVGAGYSANDPAHLLWVHATLADTALRCYEDLVGALTPDEAQTYYEEMQRVAVVFGVPLEDQPADLSAFRAYMDERLSAMAVTDTGRDLIGFILDPELPLGLHHPLRPLLRLQRLFTLGSLPASIRDQLAVDWASADERRYEAWCSRARLAFRLTPRPLRTAGEHLYGPAVLALARRHVRQFEAKQPELAPTPAA
jgi:uncharacterized protein (DUF2236 family)